jgi:hypothetical protein
MLSIKKTSLFFDKSLVFQNSFLNNNFLAFFDYFSVKINLFFDFNFEYSVFFLQSTFIKKFFKNQFFNCFSSIVLVLQAPSFNISKFFFFKEKNEQSLNIFLISFFIEKFFISYKYFSINILNYLTFDISFFFSFFFSFFVFFSIHLFLFLYIVLFSLFFFRKQRLLIK